ncbi:MAG TPA: ATP-binding protein, partial [Alphaproteobacteria bacterium]|nr:ATP-binding protein [Alphaproteobacteria bacterium]
VLIHFEEPPYLSTLKANPNQIQTLLSNLLRNAIHYAYPDTIVKIKIREKKKFIEFSISNIGPMIPIKYHRNIFKKHFKVPGQAQERSGLGLYIAQQITQSLGGKIEFKSTEKQGTTFLVDLPIASEKVEEKS